MRILYIFLTMLITLLIFAPLSWSACEGDTDCDGDVDGSDVANLASSFGDVGCSACADFQLQNLIHVAKSGGDYTSVQAALDSITDATQDNPYLVRMAPGEYSETFTMKPYVHLQGAGQEITIITSNGSLPPSQATLVLANDVSLRDLTVGNSGTGTQNVALLASAGVTRTLVADVTVRAHGDGNENYAILIDSGAGVRLQQVTALAENGSTSNYGLYNNNGAAAALRGGSFTGRGGSNARAIYNTDSGTTLETESVTALAENGSNSNYGLYNGIGAAATLRGGSFTGRGGNQAYGIYNTDSGTTLETESITALAENGSNPNYGLLNYIGAAATLRGGSFTGRGGNEAAGIYNIDIIESGTTLEAEYLAALGENGSSSNYGLYNSSATANITQSVLEGASYSVNRISGNVTVSHSRLVGGSASGTVTCVLVTRDTTISTDGSTCP